MSSVRALTAKVERMRAAIDPAPRIIWIGDVKERMLAELRSQIEQEGGDPDTPSI